jgi:hypothetical protein
VLPSIRAALDAVVTGTDQGTVVFSEPPEWHNPPASTSIRKSSVKEFL